MMLAASVHNDLDDASMVCMNREKMDASVSEESNDFYKCAQ